MDDSTQYDDVMILLMRSRPLFWALGDPERQDIIMLLARNERLSVGELALRTRLSRPAVSHHLRILKEAGLLRETREGVRRYYSPSLLLAAETMERLITTVRSSKGLL